MRPKISNPPLEPLNTRERFALTICICVAALMCGTACWNISNSLIGPPLVPPGMPRTPQSAQTLPPGVYRVGPGLDAAGFLSDGSSDAVGAQGSLNARVGLPVPGLELGLGAAVPSFQPYGVLRYQVMGQGQQSGPFLSIEGGAATGNQYTGGDYFGGLAWGKNIDPHWEYLVDGRAGENEGDGYVEAGAGLVNRPSDWVDVIAGLNFRAYPSASEANVARAGLNLEFGNSEQSLQLSRAAQAKAAELWRLYQGDPQKLFDAGEMAAAADACRAHLAHHKKDIQGWQLLAQICKAEGDMRGSWYAHDRASRLIRIQKKQELLEHPLPYTP